MSRTITVGAAQLGPIARNDSRQQVVGRLIELMRQAKSSGCDLVVYPELALTTFFPRWYFSDQEEIDFFFEREIPGPATRPLFAEAQKLALGFCIGYAEFAREGGQIRRFNTAILVDKDGKTVGKYRKVHLPGHAEHEPWRAFQHLEKRYFEIGNLGFPVVRAFGGNMGMCICNDRRWPEVYRVMGLQGVEMVMLGYNTPVHNPPAPEHDNLSNFHNHLVMQSGAYQNGTWVVGVAKAGKEEGVDQIGGTAIIAPSGEIAAQAVTLGDELIVARCDLDLTRSYKTTTFDFARHRVPEAYKMIVERKGAIPPGGG
ncbi:MAG TPA: N-carbamoyl-D-amino-acid hydrolase [Alphaproteobacteria bacterium]|nr:N-carbamoyl-D-amino-acid hydrolase [Alphaproteobacteria bacterium]